MSELTEIKDKITRTNQLIDKLDEKLALGEISEAQYKQLCEKYRGEVENLKCLATERELLQEVGLGVKNEDKQISEEAPKKNKTLKSNVPANERPLEISKHTENELGEKNNETAASLSLIRKYRNYFAATYLIPNFWGRFIRMISIEGLLISVLVYLGFPFLFIFVLGGDFNYFLDFIIRPPSEFNRDHFVFMWLSILSGIGYTLVLSWAMKIITISLPFQNRETFLSNLMAATIDNKFELYSQTEKLNETTLIFRVPLKLADISPNISVNITKNSATMTGPLGIVKKIKNSFMKFDQTK